MKLDGVTLIALVITVIILLLLADISFVALTGENGILMKSKIAKEETNQKSASEIMNLKITNIQMATYSEKQQMPSLQDLADGLCQDNEIQYVSLETKKTAKLDNITVGNANSIFTKLINYPYEFEINASLKLTSVNDIENVDNKDDIFKEDYDVLLSKIKEVETMNHSLLTQVEDLKKSMVSKNDYNSILNRVDFLEKNKTRSGSVSFGKMNGWGWVERDITFDEPLDNNNYSVTVTSSGSGDKWVFIGFDVVNKTAHGFRIIASSSSDINTGNIFANWTLSMN